MVKTEQAQPGTAVERRIHAAANPHNLTSCRINPVFLPKRCDWIFCSSEKPSFALLCAERL
jgi:hypothetical protein